MLLTLIEASAAVVTTAEAKAHLRIFHDDEDAYIDSLVATATANIDGPEGFLGRALISQKWEMTLDGFPPNSHDGVRAINLPLPPLISVEEVKYDDADGVTTELTSANYRLIGAASATGGFLLPLANTQWPTTNCEIGSVRVKFTAGYAAIPSSIKHAILLIVSHFYEHREENLDTGAKFGMLELPMGVKSLLFPHRIYS